MRIGLDIDDVLFPWSANVHLAATAAGITNGREITQWDIVADYGCDRDLFWGVVNQAYEGGMLLNAMPYAGVGQLLANVRGYGHTVHLVTARGFEGAISPLIRDHTLQWVAQHIPHDSMTFAKDKTVMRVDALLDDSVANVRSFIDAGGQAYLRDQPHNRADRPALSGVPRVDDLEHFLFDLGLVSARYGAWVS